MSNNHWFIEAISELVDEAKQDKSPNVLSGLGTVLEVFCSEAGFSDEEIQMARDLASSDTQQGHGACCKIRTLNGYNRQRLDA